MNLPSASPAPSQAAWQCFAEGNRLLSGGDLDGAIVFFRHAVQEDAQFSDALYNLGRALKDKGDLSAAAEMFERVTLLAPHDAENWYMLGNVSREREQAEQAAEAYARAIESNPAFIPAHNNLGVLAHSRGDIQRASACFREILKWNPADPDAHHNLAMAYLSGGEYLLGWPEYEWRVRTSDRMNPERTSSRRWNGEALAGRSILLTAEQGCGDAIQFIRFATTVNALGGTVLVECRPELARLFTSVQGVEGIVRLGDPLPYTDFQIPLLSVPGILGTTVETIPSHIPYLSVLPQLQAQWRTRVAPDEATLKIGLVWAGNPLHKNDRRRSLPASAFESLLDIPGCSFFALQMGGRVEPLTQRMASLPNPMADVSDFADTAALLQLFDLVISVDTAVAHLAGGLGIPVWTLLPHFPDWRWMFHRSDTPWYPTMRLFRQQRPGDWRGVLAQIRKALEASASEKRPPAIPVEQTTRAGLTNVAVDTLFGEAQICHSEGNLAAAAEKYTQILQRSPVHVGARNNLAVLLQAEGRVDEAIQHCRHALRYEPRNVAVMNNLGYALSQAGKLSEAEAILRRAHALDESIPDVLNNLGNALKKQCRYAEAIDSYRKAIQLRPDYVEAHWNLAQACLLTGRMEEGWREYEWRWKKRDFTSPRRAFSQPLWDGAPLDGKTILLHGEQGLGDALQFVRYVSRVHDMGGRIVLECHPELASLFRTLPEVDDLIAFGDPLPAFDVHAPLMSLPLCSGAMHETLSSRIPYLSIGSDARIAWSRKISQRGDHLRVGIVWSGKKHSSELAERSCPADEFALLADVPGVEWYSLQKDLTPAEREAMRKHLSMVDLAPQLHDLAETAAAMTQLDLIITIDTAAAHLAGALGRQVWLLLHYDHDWRWMTKRDDSPWYPTMRLFRQPQRGDWTGVLADVKAALMCQLRSSAKGCPVKPTESVAELNDRGLALQNAGRYAEAHEIFKHALLAFPAEPVVHYNLANTERELRDYEDAAHSYRRAIDLGLDRPEVYNNLGATLNSLSRWHEALPVLHQALVLDPAFVMARANLGYALLQQNRVEEATIELEIAVRTQPDYADAHWLLSHAYLLAGRSTEGWREYEWRWAKLDRSLYPYLTHPRWDGQQVEGKKVLLFTEQGYGDAIQFIRYASRVADRGAQVIVECQPELAPLFHGVDGIHRIVPRGAQIPAFDFQCPVMSLPQICGTDPVRSGTAPYIRVETGTVEKWATRLGRTDKALSVGLVWAGNPAHRNDRQRSITPATLARLSDVTNVRFYSLQKGIAQHQGNILSSSMHCIDVAEELYDFGETAGLLKNLDLVISVDTAVAHCAGAIGTPAWVLLPYAPDWRWLLHREDTAWYRSMRLFRQQQPGDWDEVLTRVCSALACWESPHEQ